MTSFGQDLIEALEQAVAFEKGEGPAILHKPLSPRVIRQKAKLTQRQMAPIMGMSLSGYRKWEQGARRISGPAQALLRILDREPEAARRALVAAE